MSKLIEKIEALLKAIKTKGIVAPKIKNTIVAPKMSTTAPKMPSLAPATQKNPVKQAEQIQNKDIKDMKLREAQEALKINKSTGQWELEKKEGFDIEELKDGTKHEMEHKNTILEIEHDAKEGKLKPLSYYAASIAKEHLKEISDYYSRLERLEEDAKK